MKNIRDIEGLDVAGSKGYFVTIEILEKNGTSEHKTSLENKSKH
jgi:hypothetical protein